MRGSSGPGSAVHPHQSCQPQHCRNGSFTDSGDPHRTSRTDRLATQGMEGRPLRYRLLRSSLRPRPLRTWPRCPCSRELASPGFSGGVRIQVEPESRTGLRLACSGSTPLRHQQCAAAQPPRALPPRRYWFHAATNSPIRVTGIRPRTMPQSRGSIMASRQLSELSRILSLELQVCGPAVTNCGRIGIS